jgi:ribosomal protein S18 acetylase RimI-like enzyme
LRISERLEMFWHDFVLTLPSAEELDGTVVICYPELPTFHFNHAATISVEDNEAESLMTKITKYFQSRGCPYVCFRTSPLTRPKTFTSLLEKNGFEKKIEESVMVFNGRKLEKKLNRDIRIEEVSEREVDVYTELFLTNFEMPTEWKKGFDRLALNWMHQGRKCYLAYVRERPVGTCLLSSLGGTGGIFNVGTLKEYRGRGIGTALTIRALLDSVDEGNDLHILETEKGGNAERLYRKIGFETVHSISYFVKEIKPKSGKA